MIGYWDVDPARHLHHHIHHVFILDRLTVVVLASDAEVDPRHAEHTDALTEQVVAMEKDHREVAHVVKLECDDHRLPGNGVILPPNPLVSLLPNAVHVQPEVVNALIPVNQLTEAAGQEAIFDVSIIGDVVEVNLTTPRVPLVHAVRNNAICGEQSTMLKTGNVFSVPNREIRKDVEMLCSMPS